MTLQLDPTYWPVWRDPSTLQLGVDEPLAVLTEVSPADERFLSLLRRGMSGSALDHFANVAGISAERGQVILDTLRPALRRHPRATQSLAGSSGTTEFTWPVDLRWSTSLRPKDDMRALLSALLGSVGLMTQQPMAQLTAFGLLVADYVALPAQVHAWATHDVPHTALVFMDRTVRWGPIVPSAAGGCLLCHELLLRERDNAWPAIATQAHQLRAPTHTPELEALAYAHLAADLGAWRCAMHDTTIDRSEHVFGASARLRAPVIEHPLATHTAVLDANTRRVAYWPAKVHPHCACANTSQHAEQVPPV